MICLLTGMFISVEELWNHSNKFYLKKSDCHGWILIYIGKKIFDHFNTRSSKGDIFRLKFMASIKALIYKVVRMKTQKYLLL